MPNQSDRPVGLTRNAGYQIGVRRTLPIVYQAAWKLLTSDLGVGIWLGRGSRLDFTKGEKYRLADGSTGEIRVFYPNSHLRVTWQPKMWTRPSTIQLRVIPKDDKSVIAFHQEHLPDARVRETRRAHFQSALDELERLIQKRRSEGDDI